MLESAQLVLFGSNPLNSIEDPKAGVRMVSLSNSGFGR